LEDFNQRRIRAASIFSSETARILRWRDPITTIHTQPIGISLQMQAYDAEATCEIYREYDNAFGNESENFYHRTGSGSIHRSAPVDGIVELLVKSKKYVLPLAFLHRGHHGGLVRGLYQQWRFHLIPSHDLQSSFGVGAWNRRDE